MRIWSLHPSHLDRMGLLACWRETLLAQAVLAGRTKGYRNHPQLERLRAQPGPLGTVGAYLRVVADEAGDRGYRFDASRILHPASIRGAGEDASSAPPDTPAPSDEAHPLVVPRIPVSQGQLDFEWQHLGRKLRERSPEYAARWEAAAPTAHPIFRVVRGGIEPWERP
ncbi:pyrimidine dimer DNA glycosylase/endonuclease V [Leucobacter sp.]